MAMQKNAYMAVTKGCELIILTFKPECKTANSAKDHITLEITK